MPESPRASVIINNYNYGRFLGEAIESALQQTYSNTEVIVVDDGSTDDSRDVIGRFGQRVVPVFKGNGGQGSAYNAGLAASRGEAISFLDSDDTLFPEAMERAMAVLAQSHRTAKAQWPLAVTDANGRPTGELSTKRVPPQGDLSEMIRRDGPLNDFHLHTGAIYPRWLLESIFPVPESLYRISSDEYLTTLAPVYGQIVNHSQPLGTYRNHGGNNYCGRALNDLRIREYMARFESNCAMLAEHLKQLGKHGDVKEWRRRNFNYLWLHRISLAKVDIELLVPRGHTYIMVDGDEWGSELEVPQRKRIPFLERDGQYWGSPPDDSTAVRELERLRFEGADFLVIWWTEFWWLDHYAAFMQYLRERFECMLDAEHIVAFDLRPRPRAVSLASCGNVDWSKGDEQ